MINYDYDKTKIPSIKAQAEKVLHKSLGGVLGASQISEITAQYNINRKGLFGEVVEKYLFNKEPDSSPEPDFPNAPLELKTTPIKISKRTGFTAKERLVLGMIDYFGIIEEKWMESAFLKKNANLLILFYLYTKSASILDYEFRLIKLLRLLSDLPPADIKQIQKDWEAIAAKVKAGKAHELSEADTFYLGACTKGATAKKSLKKQPNSGILAKGRAFSLKPAYLNFIIAENRAVIERDHSEIVAPSTSKDVVSFVSDKLDRYLGMSVEEIHSAVGKYLTPSSKSYFADLARAMLGAKKKKILEFEKAEVTMKIVRLQSSGMPKESMSFPAINYMDIVEEEWDSSTLRDILASRKFLFLVYKYGKDGTLRFNHHMFWNIPYHDLENNVRKVWEDTVELIRHCQADNLPGIKKNSVCHVRPHGRNNKDIAPTPCGTFVKKQSFWLNASYIRDQINKSN